MDPRLEAPCVVVGLNQRQSRRPTIGFLHEVAILGPAKIGLAVSLHNRVSVLQVQKTHQRCAKNAYIVLSL